MDPWRFLIGRPPRYRPDEIPRYPSVLAGGEHWRKVWWDPEVPRTGPLRALGLARYLCGYWNLRHPAAEGLSGVSLYLYSAPIGERRVRRKLLAYQACAVDRGQLGLGR